MKRMQMAAGKILHSQKGSSIISVMAAFFILLMGLSMVMTATTTAMRTTAKSAHVRRQTEKCMEAYYLGAEGEEITTKQHPTTFTLSEGTHSAQIPGQLTEFLYRTENMDGREETFVLYSFETIRNESGE